MRWLFWANAVLAGLIALPVQAETGCTMQAQELGSQLAQQLPAYAVRWEKIARNSGFTVPASTANSSVSQ